MGQEPLDQAELRQLDVDAPVAQRERVERDRQLEVFPPREQLGGDASAVIVRQQMRAPDAERLPEQQREVGLLDQRVGVVGGLAGEPEAEVVVDDDPVFFCELR